MDERVIREHLQEINERLAKLEEERDALLSLVKGYEGLLRIMNIHGMQRELPVLEAALSEARARNGEKGKSETKGTVSMRGAVLKVLKEARGTPLHAKEIYRRAYDMGARTSGKSPIGVVDLTAYSLMNGGEPVERTGPRLWRWKSNGSTDGGIALT